MYDDNSGQFCKYTGPKLDVSVVMTELDDALAALAMGDSRTAMELTEAALRQMASWSCGRPMEVLMIESASCPIFVEDSLGQELI